MLPSTSERVPRNTAEEINERIRRQTEANVCGYAVAGREAIDHRLAELDREWDIERCLETMAPTFSLVGLFLGITGRKRWLLLPAVVQGFFLQHALQGWCPPVPLLRRLGIRTAQEIEQERYALKVLRGDFEEVGGIEEDAAGRRVSEVMQAVETGATAAGGMRAGAVGEGGEERGTRRSAAGIPRAEEAAGGSVAL